MTTPQATRSSILTYRTVLPAAMCLAIALGGCTPQTAPLPASASVPAPTSPTAAQAAAQKPGLLDATVEAARREGELTLVWGENTAGGGAAVEQWAKGLNAQYGLNLKVNFTPGQNMNEMAAKLTQEAQANRPATSDVYLGQENAASLLLGVNALAPVDWAALAPTAKPSMIGKDGVAVQIASVTPGITYNTNNVAADAVPQTLEDLLKPVFKGRLATTPYVAQFDRLAMSDMWGEQRTKDYLTKLSAQSAGLIRCGEAQRIISGEFEIFAMDCGRHEARKWLARGAPVGHVIPSDAAAIGYYYMGVPATAGHPNAAKLFISHVLSRKGQDVLYAVDSLDHYLIEGSKTASDIQEVQNRGVILHQWDLGFMVKHGNDALAKAQSDLQRIVQKQ